MSDVQEEPIVQPTDPVEPTPAEPEVKQPDTSWVPKRISEITAARRAAEARAAELEAELARLRAGQQAPEQPTIAPTSREDFDKLVNARADAIAAQRSQEASLTSRIAEVNAAGAKEFGEDYEKSTQNLAMAGIGGPDFLRVITNVPNPEKVVTWLGKPENLNEAMRIASLDPIQMGIEMTKLSSKAAKDLGKQISKVPPPVQTVDGGGGGGDGGMPDPEKDPKGFIAWRNKNARKRQ
jgi:hypothetical protein